MSGELCGFEPPDDIYIPPGNHSEIRIQFTSDGSTQYAGFAVKVMFGPSDTTSTGLRSRTVIFGFWDNSHFLFHKTFTN